MRRSLLLLLTAPLVACAMGGGGGPRDLGPPMNRPDLGGAHDSGMPGDGAPGVDGGPDLGPPDLGPPDFGPIDGGDPCAVCDPAAACDTRSGVHCVCPSGYTDAHGDGSLCTPPSACASATCDPHATCAPDSAAPMGYTCTCAAGWMGSGTTCSDVDECAMGTAGCGANATCVNVPGSVSCLCNPGFTGDGHSCSDVDECGMGTSGCSPSAMCTNTPGSYYCTCLPGYVGDGRTCSMVSVTTVLVYDESAAGTLVDEAARALGMTVLFASDPGTFDAYYDAGGFQAVAIDSAYNYMGSDVTSRIGSWASGGNRLVFAYWALDTDGTLPGQLGVSLGGSFTASRYVYGDSASGASFLGMVPSPELPTDDLFDDGDVVTPFSGSVAAEFDYPGGPAAIAITSSNRVVVNGFSPYELNSVDADGDGVYDAQEIWQAELSWVAAH